MEQQGTATPFLVAAPGLSIASCSTLHTRVLQKVSEMATSNAEVQFSSELAWKLEFQLPSQG